jgi:hypothetical protein
MSEQLGFSGLLTEAEQTRQAALDRHRECVQRWFEGLSTNEKQQLAAWFAQFEWDTCVALSAAAGSYSATHLNSI